MLNDLLLIEYLNNSLFKIHLCVYVFLVVIIKDRSSPDGVSRTTGQVVSPKVIGINKVIGASSNGEAVVGKDTAKALTAASRQDTVSRDTVTAIGTAGINSIITTNIGASNNRVDRLRLAAKL